MSDSPVTGRRVLILGSGDIGTAVACRLFEAGYDVVVSDVPAPADFRRTPAFCEAIFEGSTTVAGVTARRLDDLSRLDKVIAMHAEIPVMVQFPGMVLDRLRPDVMVDARMRKREQPETQRGMAPLTIGIGPNFIAGETVDAAIEFGFIGLGSVIWQGPTAPQEGDPGPILGYTRERFIYAPAAGHFRTAFKIGDHVSQGQPIAELDGLPLLAPLTGILRGITHDDVPVQVGTKIIEVDPRPDGELPAGPGKRALLVAEGVLSAIAVWDWETAAGRRDSGA